MIARDSKLPARHHGFTLIEIMVAIVVMSIGLLGVAGLQAVAAKYKINTWARSNVAVLVSDIAEKIRINSDVAGTNVMQGVDTPSKYLFDASTSGSTWTAQQDADLTPDPDCASASCTATQRAAYDMLVWRKQVRDALPQGAVWLTGDKGAGYDATLMWFDKEYTEKGGSLDATDDDNKRELQTSANCRADMTGMAQQSCCPAAASVVAGVRCARYRFIP